MGGLLCARRLLQKYGLDQKFAGTEEVTAEFEDCFVIAEDDDEDGPKAFHALLDVGLKRTTLGSKIFAAMKGAFDGGLEIPHSEKKFYGYDPDEGEYDAESNRERILGGHVSQYMESMQEEEPEEYEEKFKKYIEAGIDQMAWRTSTLACTRLSARTLPTSQPRRRSLLTSWLRSAMVASATPTRMATLSSSTAAAVPLRSARTACSRRRTSSSTPSLVMMTMRRRMRNRC